MGESRMPGEGRYAKVEREQRWLVASPPPLSGTGDPELVKLTNIWFSGGALAQLGPDGRRRLIAEIRS